MFSDEVSVSFLAWKWPQSKQNVQYNRKDHNKHNNLPFWHVTSNRTTVSWLQSWCHEWSNLHAWQRTILYEQVMACKIFWLQLFGTGDFSGANIFGARAAPVFAILRKISCQDDFYHTPVSLSVFHCHFQFVSFFPGSPQDRISNSDILRNRSLKGLDLSNIFSQIMSLSYLIMLDH